MERKADDVNWQQSARGFSVGDVVHLLNGSERDVGRVVAVYPAIGMVDLQFPSGWTRRPVEDLVKLNKNREWLQPPPLEDEHVPGGAGTVPVSAGPPKVASTRRVAEAYIKKALYWAAVDRQYRPTQEEVDSGSYMCPKCRGQMGKARYKRRNGISERLFACHNCLCLIKPLDAGLDHEASEEDGA